ncbi:MAG: O-acetylhomoserine aminocarboxypropyltransferase/cysteine synthase [Oscillospiraceae bacterium]|nr:O-acetylhomoserine aminocarboxypropyltransferase/cysteine synthase [Oscillospiraceae bacterium]
MKFETKQIHAGHGGDHTRSVQTPVHLTTGYSFDDTEHARRLFSLEETGYIYTRLNNPTNAALEERLAALDGGIGALAATGGHAAMVMTFMNLCSAGDEIVSASGIYGGAINLMDKTLKQFGINFKFVDAGDPGAFERATTEKTRAYFVESIGNPLADVPDLEAISKIAKKQNVVFIVDNTMASPYLLRPIEHGADLVIYSTTKYMVGNGTVMGGAIVDAGSFDYLGDPRFPAYNTPDPSYKGLVYAEALGKAAFITKLRTHILRDIGACQSPFNAWITLLGMETLSLRMERHSSNALAVAEFLEAHPAIERVNYPKLKSSPYYGLAEKYLPLGAGSTFTADLKGGREAAAKFCDGLRLLKIVANLGDLRSMVNCPALTTHSQLSDGQLLGMGIVPGSVRFSIGLENIEDIIEDLEQALKGVV